MPITIPYQFTPRTYQIPIFKAIDNGFLRIIQVWNRRSGKEKTDINIVAKKIFEKVGAYYYIFPTYNQGKKILWNGADKEGIRFLNHFPQETISRTVGNEMFIEFKNGSTFQVVGSDNIDSIVGTNPLGVVFSEYSLQDPQVWDYIRPILAENGGWAIFNFTPRGENHAKDLLDYALTDPKNWFVSMLNVDDTKTMSLEVLEQERKEIIAKNGDDAIFQQEYYNSFTAAMQGSYYGKIIEQMEIDGKITAVPYEPNLLVDTWWDLGINDSMTIGFFQKHGLQWRMIDYIEGSGEGLKYYIDLLAEKKYSYGKHYAPHDIVVKELGTGKSRLETAKSLGIKFETVTKPDGSLKSAVPMLSIDDGINAVRNKLITIWIDKEKCKRVIKALKDYHKDYDEVNKVYRNNPKHNWSSHCFTGDTKILTSNGMYPIMELDNHKILTTNGWKKMKQLGITKRNAELVEVTFKDNTKVRCTLEHLFLTDKGWKSAESLKNGSRILSSLTLSRSILMASCIVFIALKNIFRVVVGRCIDTFGEVHLAKYLKGAIYTIRIVIQKIIGLKIWNAYQVRNIYQRIGNTLIQERQFFSQNQPEMEPLNGTHLTKEDFGTAEWRKEHKVGQNGKEKQKSACGVKKSLKELLEAMGIVKNSVTQIVKPLTIERVEKLCYKEDVYDISVPIEHNFSLSNGAVVHNCADMIRYWAVTNEIQVVVRPNYTINNRNYN